MGGPSERPVISLIAQESFGNGRAKFLCTGCTVSFLFPTKTKYLRPCKQFGGAMNGKAPLWFCFLFFVKRNELDAVETAQNLWV